MNEILLGAIALGNLVIGLFFLKFWKKTRDRFFLFFAVAFSLEGLNRILLSQSSGLNEYEPYLYLVRLLSFVLILIAILDKNRKNKPHADN